MHKWKLVSLAALGVAVTVVVRVPEVQRPHGIIPLVTTKMKTTTKTRMGKIYPYSVIPGGAQSGVELRAALFHDGVAGAHYADFHLDRTRVETLREPRKVFVSYRIADRIYWTRNRLSLPKGETILTDGVSSARTRCGNRLSELPQFPVNAALEPSEDVLDLALPKDFNAGFHPLPDAAAINPAPPAKSMAVPSGDLLSRFGPGSLGSMPGPGFSSGGPAGFGGSSGGPGGSPPASAYTPGQSTGLAGSSGTTGNSSVSQSGTTPTPGSESGSTTPAPSNNVVTPPTGAVPAPGNTQTAVFIPTAPLPLPFMGGFVFPTVPIGGYSPSQIVEETVGSSNSTFLPGGTNPVPVLNSVQPVLPTGTEIPNAQSSYLVQVPEPHSLTMGACGIALLLVGFVRTESRRRRALR